MKKRRGRTKGRKKPFGQYIKELGTPTVFPATDMRKAE